MNSPLFITPAVVNSFDSPGVHNSGGGSLFRQAAALCFDNMGNVLNSYARFG